MHVLRLYLTKTSSVAYLPLNLFLLYLIFTLGACSQHTLSQTSTNTSHFGKTNKKESKCKQRHIKWVLHPILGDRPKAALPSHYIDFNTDNNDNYINNHNNNLNKIIIVAIFIGSLLYNKSHEPLATVILFILHSNPSKMIIKILISQGRSQGPEGWSKLLKTNSLKGMDLEFKFKSMILQPSFSSILSLI